MVAQLRQLGEFLAGGLQQFAGAVDYCNNSRYPIYERRSALALSLCDAFDN
jgi:hypothetical protein